MNKPVAIPVEPIVAEGSPVDGTDEVVTSSEEVPVSMSERDKAMATISARVREEREVDGEPEEEAVEGTISPVDMDAEIPVKIDGEDKVVPFKDVVAEFQKSSSASARIQEAAEAEKDLEKREAELKRRENEFDTKARVPDAPVVDTPERKQNVVALREAIYDGDEAALDAAIERVIPETPTPGAPIDTAAVASDVMFRMDLRTAVEKYEKDYPDLANNPKLRNWVDEETETIGAANPAMSPGDVIEAAAKSVQDQVAAFSKEEDVGEKLDSAEREGNKEKLVAASVPIAPSAKASIGEDAPAPPSRTDIVQKMQKDRGQTT